MSLCSSWFFCRKLCAVPSIVPQPQNSSRQLLSALLPPASVFFLPPPCSLPSRFLLWPFKCLCCKALFRGSLTQAKGQSGSASHIRSYRSRGISIITLEKFLQQTSTEYLCNIFQGLLIALRILWHLYLTHDLSFSVSSLELLLHLKAYKGEVLVVTLFKDKHFQVQSAEMIMLML